MRKRDLLSRIEELERRLAEVERTAIRAQFVPDTGPWFGVVPPACYTDGRTGAPLPPPTISTGGACGSGAVTSAPTPNITMTGGH